MIFDPVTQDDNNFDKEFPPSMDPVIFLSEGKKLLGTMFIANGKGPHPVILLLHGFPGNETNFDLAHSFKRAGFNVFVFHYRGTWGSEGEFSFSNGIKDTSNAIKFLRNPDVAKKYRIKSDDIKIVGYSMGGFFGLYNALNDYDIKDSAFIAGFNFGLFGEIIPSIEMGEAITRESLTKGTMILPNADADNLYNEIISNTEDWNLINHINSGLDKNLLMISALFDSIAPLDIHHKPLAAAAKYNKITLEEYILETGHGFSNKRIELSQKITKWLRKDQF